MSHIIVGRFALPVALIGLALSGCDSPTEGEEHLNIVAIEVDEIDGANLARYQNGVWSYASGDALHLHPGEETDVRIYFIEADGDRRQLPFAGEDHTLRVVIDNTAVVSFEEHGDHGAFVAGIVGEARGKIQALHGGHPDYDTEPGMSIEVVDHAEH